MQGGNYILPVVAIPVLVRYLGPGHYGIFNLAQTWGVYFSVIIAYGFELSATKQIALHRDDACRVSEIYAKVLSAKVYLFFSLLAVFLLLILSSDNLRQYYLVYILMYLWTLSTVFFQGWLYLGIEDPARVSIFNFLSRAIAFLLLLFFIYLKLSLLALVFAYVFPQVIVAYVFHVKTVNDFGIDFRLYSLRHTILFLKQSFSLFLSTIAGTLTISLSTIALGFLSNEESVGYFSVSTKIVSLIFGLVLYPFQIVLLPIIVRKLKESTSRGLDFFYKVLAGSSLIMATVIAVIYIFAADIIAVFVGSGFDLAVYSLKILCWVPLFSLADTLFGYLFIALEKRRVYISVVLIGSFLCLILNLSLTPRYNLIGSSYSWLCAEICCFVCFVLYFAIKVLPSVKSVPPTTFNATLK